MTDEVFDFANRFNFSSKKEKRAEKDS